EMELHVPYKPVRVDVDPQFDLFRRLSKGETPIALSKTFGSEKMLIVLPSREEAEPLDAYRRLAHMWSTHGANGVEVTLDSELTELPSDRAVILLGWENFFVDEMAAALSTSEVSITPTGVTIGGTSIPRADHSVALTADNPKNTDHPLTWAAVDNVKSVPGLGRKLPHYGKYGYAMFRGNEPENILKGRWPVLGSSLTAYLGDEDRAASRVERGRLPARKPLAAPAE
ncbi:MAG: hypothetical protein RDU20_21975, partial [Desulfomonilaceae bacterium]|nr:hypothetical protein [Desulfomonilaceae bacterium]